MALSFEAFLWGESMQESGGNYSVVGPQLSSGRAYGKFQIMDFNIPNWSREILGYSITPQQFLNSPSLQDQIVRGKFKKYWDAYGARGAAAAWYSGDPNLHMSTAPQGDAGPSIKEYVDSVLRHAASYDGRPFMGLNGGTSTSGGGGSTPSAVGSGGSSSQSAPKLSREDLMSRFGMTANMLNNSRTLTSIFNKAVAGNYSAARFQAEVQNSEWWLTNNKTWREAWTQKYTDPATFGQKLAQNMAKVHGMMREAGYSTLDKKRFDETAEKLRDNIQWLGWTDTQINQWLGANLPLVKNGDLFGGKAGAWQQTLTEYAYQNGFPQMAYWRMNNFVKQISSGAITMDQAKHEIRKISANAYPAYRTQIEAGVTVMELASPYIKTMSKLLELPDGKLDMGDSMLRSAMSYRDTKTGKAAALPLWQFEDRVKNDARWMKTSNAQDDMMSAAHKVAQDFGMVY